VGENSDRAKTYRWPIHVGEKKKKSETIGQWQEFNLGGGRGHGDKGYLSKHRAKGFYKLGKEKKNNGEKSRGGGGKKRAGG